MRAVALATCMLALSCSTTSSAKKGDGTGDGAEKLSENIRQKQAGNEKVTEFDLNGDKKPDVWTYTVEAKGPDGKTYEKLVRKELDINWDGKVDYWEYWEGDQVDRVGEDLDGDGNVDKWTKNPNSES